MQVSDKRKVIGGANPFLNSSNFQGFSGWEKGFNDTNSMNLMNLFD